MATKRKPKPPANTNGQAAAIPEDRPEGAYVAQMEDFIELMETIPNLEMPLINIVQKRLLAEKDAEIAALKGVPANEVKDK